MERDQDQCKPFSAFDEKIIPESLRFFKCCLSVFPVSMRPVMAILIKFLELKLTIDYFHSHPRTSLFQDKDVSLDSILSSLNPDLKEEMDLLQSMMQMMQMSQADGTSGSGNPPDFFKDLFSSSMPDAYDNTENLSKEVNDGRLDETSGIFKPPLIKQELLLQAYQKTRGKTGKNLAPALMGLIVNANKQGIRFSQKEFTLIMDLFKEGKSPARVARSDQTISAVSTLLLRKKK